jgi:hypothetical protein
MGFAIVGAFLTELTPMLLMQTKSALRTLSILNKTVREILRFSNFQEWDNSATETMTWFREAPPDDEQSTTAICAKAYGSHAIEMRKTGYWLEVMASNG